MRRIALGTALSMALAVTARNADACSFYDISPTAALPTMPPPQVFSFVATNDCTPLTFSARNGTMVHTPTPGAPVGPDRRRYTVRLTEDEWRSIVRSNAPTFHWWVGTRNTSFSHNSDLDTDRDGWTRSSGDLRQCDRVPARNPAAEDICDNGIDDDCDGVTDNCGLADPDLTILAPPGQPGALLGLRGTVAVGDVDGDGAPDLLLGSTTVSTDDGFDQGAVFLVNGLDARGTIDARDVPAISGTTGAERSIGMSVGADDHDLDGIDDVLSTTAEVDRAFLFLGPITGNRRIQDADAMLVATWPWVGRDDAALTGDVGGDGIPDAVFGAPNAGVDRAGRVYAASGPLTGTVSLDTDATYTFTGNERDRLGASTTPVGDLTGDGIDELAIGNSASSTDLKSVYLFEGGVPPGTFDAATAAWVTLTSEERVSDIGGGALVADDYDGDGALDLIVGDSDARRSGGDHSGVVYGLLGPFSGGGISAASADVRWEAALDWIHLGTAVAAGDLDADGELDVTMGAPSAPGAGCAYVQRGFATGTVDVGALPSFTGPVELDRFGSSITLIPDRTGDGAPEIAIGATRVNNTTGAVYLFESDDLF